MLLFVVTELSRSVVEGELRQFLGRVRRSRMIERMSNHEIVCGYGRMGRAVVDELQRAGREVVIVERSADRVRGLQESGYAVVGSDATSEATLLAANITQARGLVSCLNDDAHNIYTVLTARSLNPEVFIVTRVTEESAEQRILHAGANRVVNPYHLGGTRLTHLSSEACYRELLRRVARWHRLAARPGLGGNGQLVGRSYLGGGRRSAAVGPGYRGRAA